ncbi:hypothetical protein [Candidatus Nitrosocosmicus sp. SS]|jgi:hypothetical protein|nr:hypothetical protein [Candidatus Nitrosocosmicus sp. SS]KAF0868758.1 hypothetical protein E5N71_08745 [Candidatus Nitrosocosmicus sp. SS]
MNPLITQTLSFTALEIRSDGVEKYTPTGCTYSISKSNINNIGCMESIINHVKEKSIEYVSKS